MKNQIKAGWKLMQSAFFGLLKNRAINYLQKPLLVFGILNRLVSKMQYYRENPQLTKDVWTGLNNFYRLIKSYVTGSYRQVSKTNVIYMFAAILYFIIPTDFIPDTLPFIGLVDDVSIIIWLMDALQIEIASFLDWEEGGQAAPEEKNAPKRIRGKGNK